MGKKKSVLKKGKSASQMIAERKAKQAAKKAGISLEEYNANAAAKAKEKKKAVTRAKDEAHGRSLSKNQKSARAREAAKTNQPTRTVQDFSTYTGATYSTASANDPSKVYSTTKNTEEGTRRRDTATTKGKIVNTNYKNPNGVAQDVTSGATTVKKKSALTRFCGGKSKPYSRKK